MRVYKSLELPFIPQSFRSEERHVACREVLPPLLLFIVDLVSSFLLHPAIFDLWPYLIFGHLYSRCGFQLSFVSLLQKRWLGHTRGLMTGSFRYGVAHTVACQLLVALICYFIEIVADDSGSNIVHRLVSLYLRD